MQQRTWWLAVFVVVVACGHHDEPAPSAGVATGSAHAASPTAAPPSSDDRACKLITQDEAAKLLGHAVKPGEPHPTGPIPGCRFKSDGAAGSVLMQYFDRGEQNIEQIRTSMIKDAVTIPNAGTKAYRNADGSLLLVLANGHLGVVVAMSFGKLGSPTAAAADAFAPVLASRL